MWIMFTINNDLARVIFFFCSGQEKQKKMQLSIVEFNINNLQ